MMIQTRRDFLKKAGSLSLSALLLPQIAEAAKLKKFGIQLYTLRATLDKDAKNLLTQLAASGYKEIEAYGIDSGKFHGFTPVEFKKIVDDLGMKLISAHAMPMVAFEKDAKASLDELVPNWKKAVQTANEAGLKYITCPWWQEKHRQSGDDYKKTAEILNKLGEYSASQGLKFAYHNHAFEFDVKDGIMLYDTMLA
ncbi:MAG: TIM barrel protein, partial [Verrucomicrobia bacterium]|nr:TIM barrel protein [Cytophagales bacterium]